VSQAGCAVPFETSKPLTSILSPFGGERKLAAGRIFFLRAGKKAADLSRRNQMKAEGRMRLTANHAQPRERFSLSSPNEERAGVRS
jgi:hypothetical protein